MKRCIANLIVLAAVASVLTAPAAGNPAPTRAEALGPRPVVIPRADDPLSPQTKESLVRKNQGWVTVWLFFTDKGVRTQAEFQYLAATVIHEERTLRRRAKVGLSRVVFADLPIESSYVRQVVGLGGKLRRISRWLNAGSFDIPISALDDVVELPFVARVAPVASLQGSQAVPSRSATAPGEGRGSPWDLPYGSATEQLEQINVPPVHQKGFDGRGVLLAIIDCGFRTTHQVFTLHYAQGRVLAEWDFVDDDPYVSSGEDWGTSTWSIAAGYRENQIIGPAYGASFLLARSDDVSHDYPAEEDYWVAALEWADSCGADVVSSSVSYYEWYSYELLDGNHAVITLASNLAAGMGIVLCNAIGDRGPDLATLNAPGDAFDVLTCGAVDEYDQVIPYASRGPTADGRIKPEVCARGLLTACALYDSDSAYGLWSGSWFSTPLVAGAACLMVQARPAFSPQLIRAVFVETASEAADPDNYHGWGIVDLDAAITWGPHIDADIRIADTPFIAQFSGSSTIPTDTWVWSFGDGDSAVGQYPSHLYDGPGVYDVSLTIHDTLYGDVTDLQRDYIIRLADTLKGADVMAAPGRVAQFVLWARNIIPLRWLHVPVVLSGPLDALVLDSISVTGCRTADFESAEIVHWDGANRRFTISLRSSLADWGPELEPGIGPIVRLFFSTPDATEDTLWAALSFSGYNGYLPTFSGDLAEYIVPTIPCTLTLECCWGRRGNVDYDYDDEVNIVDLSYLVAFLFSEGPEPPCLKEANVDGDAEETVNIVDLTRLVNYLFAGGEGPVDCP